MKELVAKVHFWTFRNFFKNPGLTFETSDFDFCDLLNELFYMKKKFFSKKIKIADLISKSWTKIQGWDF